MNNAKQKLLLGYMISSPDVFSICSPIIDTSYFDPEYRSTVKFILKYYSDYNAIPTPEQVRAETDVSLDKSTITKDQIEYSCKEIEKFCRHKAMVQAVLAGADIVEKSEHSTNIEEKDLDYYSKIETMIRDALMVGIQRDPAVSLFGNVDEQLQRVVDESVPYSLGWTEFDEVLDGGLRRQELILFSASSGVGKSQVLGNVGYALSKRHKLRILYISLELPVKTIFKRYVAMLTDINPRDLDLRVSEASVKVKNAAEDYGDVQFVRMPAGTTALQMRAFLKEFILKYGYVPDVCVLDYIDQMSAPGISAENISVKDKMCSEQFCEILVDFNMIGATASQLNRSGVNATEHHHGQIAGGLTKINTTDIYVSIQMTEVMRAQGQIAFHFQKTRSSDGTGKTVFMNWNRQALRIENPGPDKRKK